MNAIKASRRAKGLCYKCDMKWAPNHKCAPTVAIHVVEELWQLLQEAEPSSPQHLDNESDSGDDLMSLYVHAVNGTEAPKTMRVIGNLFGEKPLILIDSDSSSNFISEQMVVSFPNWAPLHKPIAVRVANGTSILCTHQLSNCELYVQGHCFSVDLKNPTIEVL